MLNNICVFALFKKKARIAKLMTCFCVLRIMNLIKLSAFYDNVGLFFHLYCVSGKTF